MNLRALQYLVKLADLRHFSKAAEACFVSQPTLSTQIRKLEEEIARYSKEGYEEIVKMQKKKLDELKKTQSIAQGLSKTAGIKYAKFLDPHDLRKKNLVTCKKLSVSEQRQRSKADLVNI